MPNSYSRTWFELFLETRASTKEELAFIVQNLPSNDSPTVLDVCCGHGRISNPLAQLGYPVVGVDRDERALEIARSNAPATARYTQLDMRRTEDVDGQFDTVLCWWQSFGYFDSATNMDVLRQMATKLKTGGRLLLDLYQLRYWRQNQGHTQVQRNGVTVLVDNCVMRNRLTSRLQYGNGMTPDVFEWQLYDLDEIASAANSIGMRLILACTGCNSSAPVTKNSQSMQLVFEKAP